MRVHDFCIVIAANRVLGGSRVGADTQLSSCMFCCPCEVMISILEGFVTVVDDFFNAAVALWVAFFLVI